MQKLLISLFDYTGNTSRPYKENGWKIIQVDKQLGINILKWNYKKYYQNLIDEFNNFPEVAIIAMIPCTAYALSGNKHKKKLRRKILFVYSQMLVAKTKEIIDFFDNMGVLKFWMVENPMSDIHTHNNWLGNVRTHFDPCDFAGYDPIPDNSRYNKRTWLWGNYNQLTAKRMDPFQKNSPIWEKYGGKSLKTKNARSETPLGFSYAFYEANH